MLMEIKDPKLGNGKKTVADSLTVEKKTLKINHHVSPRQSCLELNLKSHKRN